MSTAARVKEDDIVLLRAGSGTIHLGVRLGRIHDTFCCTIIDSEHVRTWTGEEAAKYADEKSQYVCEDCCEVGEMDWEFILKITGWS